MITVVMPTRDRPDLFAEALASVLGQVGADFDVVVVNDGSSDANLAAYEALPDLSDPRVTRIDLPRRANGHGSSYAINVGVHRSEGTYVAFLDDDDVWTDSSYLATVATALSVAVGTVDVHIANQVAYANDVRQDGPIWLEDLADTVPLGPGPTVAAPVDPDLVVATGRFCHYNTLVVRRDFYLDVGGLDETIRWENDRDLFHRLMDRATLVLYSPTTVSRHNVPDPKTRVSITTTHERLEKLLYQLRVFDKAILYHGRDSIRSRGCLGRGYTLKKIAELLAAEGRVVEAHYYAKAALGALPTLKWRGYTGYLAVRALLAGRSRGGAT